MMKLKDQVQFCQQAAALLQAGFSLADVLRYMTISQPKNAKTWQQLDIELGSGQALSQSFATAGMAPIVSQQLQLAQVHGDLAQALSLAGEYLAFKQGNRTRIGQLMVYPVLLVGLLITFQVVLTFGILPTLALKSSGLMRQQLLIIGGIVLVLGMVTIGYRRLSLTAKVRLIQNVPVLNSLWRTYYRYVFASGAAQFYQAGSDILAYAQMLQQSESVLTSVGRQVEARLAVGEELRVALTHPLIAAEVTQLLTIGQTDAFITQGLLALTRMQFEQLRREMERVITLIQPLMFLMIGGEILLVYLQILMPIYDVMGGVV